MKPWILALVMLVTVTACKTPCSDTGSAASLVSNVVVAKWSCQAPDQVLDDVSAVCSKLGLCTVGAKLKEAPPTGPVANFVCPLIVGQLQSLAAGKVPPAWQCDPSKVGSSFTAGLTALCEQLPF